MDNVEELDDSELKECLELTNASLKMNPHLLRQGRVQLVKKGAGPQDAYEFMRQKDLREYNGEHGGKFYKWYAPGVFLRELKRLGCSRSQCSERVVEEALQKRRVVGCLLVARRKGNEQRDMGHAHGLLEPPPHVEAQQGEAKELPDLRTARYHLGCSSYMDKDGNQVSFLS